MGDWYIDRSRNLSSDTKWIKSLIFSINRIDPKNNGVNSKELINLLPDILKTGRNPYAVLTFLRDIGFINLNNQLGENSKLLIENKLTYWELIFELLFKRYYSKDICYGIKPLIVIIVTLYKLYESSNQENAYITWSDCSKYLFNINDYKQINNDLINGILKNREDNLKSNNFSVLDIWFNSLKNIVIFINDESKDRLAMNVDYLSFYKRIVDNLQLDNFVEEEIKDRKELYNYYGSSNNGIINFIPNIENAFLDINFNNIEDLYNYIFGISNSTNIQDTSNSFFGVYKDFLWCSRIALRKILIANVEVGKKLIDYSLQGSIEGYENRLFKKITDVYNDMKEKGISKSRLDNHINELASYDLSILDQAYVCKIKENFEHKCCICDESYEPLLEVIRIKQFSEDLNLNEFFDENNSLLLCTEHTKLFKDGLISYNMGGYLEVNENLVNSNYKLNLYKDQFIRSKYLNSQRRKYLGYHNQKKFKKV